ncbi:MAG TPA: LysE family translocator [Tepidisphaeraceae bacterium]|jgi:homoserine/homoserine lactone efflux protein|nr:LysE family translocator [Tepidisphaeraceae bacterium]
MHLDLYFAFVIATTVLMLIPGPNVALIVANSVAYGQRYGLLTVAGTSTAMVVQLFLTALGLSELLRILAFWFEWARWAGVAYLVYLGVKQWLAQPVDLTMARPQARSISVVYVRGFWVSLTNPKTLLFYGAFFPQFLVPTRTIPSQILLLATTFLVLAIVLDGSWAIASARVRPLLAKRGRLRNRAAGGMLIGAAAGLALARRR